MIVGGFLLEFLDKDPYCKELKSNWLNQWAAAGLLASFSRVYLNAEPTTKNLVPWFMDRVTSDLLTLQNSNEQQFKAFIDKLSGYDLTSLESMTSIVKKYHLDPEEFSKDFKEFLSKITDKDDRGTHMLNFFSDAILHAEVRILSFLYEQWFGKTYVYKPVERPFDSKQKEESQKTLFSAFEEKRVKQNQNFKPDFGTYLQNTYKSKPDTTIHLLDPFPMFYLMILPGIKGSFSTYIDDKCASFDFDEKVLSVFLGILEQLGICSKSKTIRDFEADPDNPLQIDFRTKPIMVTGVVLSCRLGEQTSSIQTGESFVPVIIQDVKIAQEPVAVFIPPQMLESNLEHDR